MLKFSGSRVCYDAPGDKTSTRSGLKNQMIKVSRLPKYERVFPTGSGASGLKTLLCSKPKNMVWTKNIFR